MAGKVYDGEPGTGNGERSTGTGNGEPGTEALTGIAIIPKEGHGSRFPVPGSRYPWINALIWATTAAAIRSGA